MNPIQTTITELRDGIANQTISAVDATRACLDRIASAEPTLHALSEIYNDRALQRAADADAGKITGPLAGIPIILKDNLCTTFGTTSCSSKMLAEYRSPFNATAVRLLENAGAIVLAKSNMDEFAMGSSTENSANGPTKNPYDTTRVPGGSSGGSAAAVAAGYAPVALGSDTGGSIRQPAALCGVVGLKPTYGLVSRSGLVAFASSLDQIGPFARNVTDTALILEAIAAHDPADSTSAPTDRRNETNYTADIDKPIENLRIGVAKQHRANKDNHPAVNAALENAISLYTKMGAEIVEVDLPHAEYGIAAYYLIATAEASSNLARYDGVHFGHRSPTAETLEQVYSRSRAEGFGDEVKRRIMLGTYALSSGYYDAYYLRALKVRRLIRDDFIAAFNQCDSLLCPTTTHPAFRIGEQSDDPLHMYLNDIYTVTANLAGIPAISLPAAFTDPTPGTPSLPIGLQLMGPLFSEAKLLRTAKSLEQALNVASTRPALPV